jgi:hypothetical protein
MSDTLMPSISIPKEVWKYNGKAENFGTLIPAVCGDQNSDFCLKSFQYSTDGKTWTDLQFIKYFPLYNRLDYDEKGHIVYPRSLPYDGSLMLSDRKSSNVPPSSYTSLWGIGNQNISHAFQYALVPTFEIGKSGSNAQERKVSNNFSISPFFINVSIIPLSDFKEVDPKDSRYGVSLGPTSGSLLHHGTCWSLTNLDKKVTCVDEQPFGDPNLIFRVTFHTQNMDNSIFDLKNFQMFMTSRTLGSGVSFKTVKGLGTDFSFEGSPVSVYTAQGKLTIDSSNVKKFFASIRGMPESAVTDRALNSFINRDLKLFSNASFDSSNNYGWGVWSKLSDKLNINSVDKYSIWNFQSTMPLGRQGVNDYLAAITCAGQTPLVGYVSSNSTLMESMPPVFNLKDQSLNFNLAAPHVDENGKVINGNYQLVLSAKVTQCLWKNFQDGSSAQISVLSEDGSKEVSTAVMRSENGYFHFQVSNFHYSAPTISIKPLG